MAESWLLVLLKVLWTAWAVEALLCAGQVAWFARRLGRPQKPYATHRPMAWVIVPFKGLDEDLAVAVAGLCTQNYPDYRLVFVFEAASDPAYEIVCREAARFPQRKCEIVLAGVSGPKQGQKTHNQLAALGHIDPRSSAEDVWVFADSDAVPDEGWLAAMVGPLGQSERYGVTTGYRWLVPTAEGGRRPTTAAQWASVMNSSVACLLGRPWTTFAWGGSMAVNVGTARRGGLMGRLEGALTDDYPLSRMCRELGLKIRFVPRCLVPTPTSFSLGGLWNLGHRQYLITRVYTPGLYAAALTFTTVYVAGLVSAWGWLLTHLNVKPWAAAGVLWPAAAIAVVAWANWRRTEARQRAISRAFGEGMREKLRTAMRWDRWGTPVWMTLHWLVMLRALLGRTMRWRGIRYRVRGPQDVQRLDEPAAGAGTSKGEVVAGAGRCDTTSASQGSQA